MSRRLPILDDARIASPCDKSWQVMSGDDRTRFCDSCEKHVYNLIGMSDDAVEALISEKEGHLCVRLYQRADGTLLTSDCPVGLRAVRRKLTRAVGAVAACMAMLMTAVTFGAFNGWSRWRVRDTQPFSRIANWYSPPPPVMVLGDICAPTSPLTAPNAETIEPGNEGGDL
jgi:hypothetical protein